MSTTSLRRARDFVRVQSTGRRAHSDGITVTAAPGPDADAPSRLGMVVGRAAGPAVVRNRIKRRVRAAWRALQPGPGLDVVVRPSRTAASVPYQELAEHLETALTRATAGGKAS